MLKFNNYYYAQYATTCESEPGYDSDSPEVLQSLKNSPTYILSMSILKRREQKKSFYKNWKNRIIKESGLESRIEKKCGMRVKIRSQVVTYIYESELDNNEKYFKYKIVYRYSKILQKWYFSVGYSFIPDALNIKQIFKHRVDDPISPKVIKIVNKIREAIDAFLEAYSYIFQFIDYAEKKYPDIEFQIDQRLIYLKMLLKDKTWPKNIKKINKTDTIFATFKFDKNLDIDSINFQYLFLEDELVSEKIKQIYMDLLRIKFEVFLQLPLYEAFTHFME
ncbi:PREDICTED: uncharacterized protein LOC106793683 [Polistes canadensis]|uniref:uncharacterized protein LOC106793683 n=1 Tax=Polistes canadensis TaxID=91411 RepID=UPI00071905B6|nr:PREDICTED: uncharacterized protein LOC106793683 [Polistes canadensis]